MLGLILARCERRWPSRPPCDGPRGAARRIRLALGLEPQRVACRTAPLSPPTCHVACLHVSSRADDQHPVRGFTPAPALMVATTCLAAMHQEDEDMEGEHESIATPATELAVAAPSGPTPTTDTTQGAAEDLGWVPWG
uniref:Uncharacterized protein n=1 Tax=Florenciella parvula TaxID=236787 RepID=A0A7S2BTJ4_9STRA